MITEMSNKTDWNCSNPVWNYFTSEVFVVVIFFKN